MTDKTKNYKFKKDDICNAAKERAVKRKATYVYANMDHNKI